jgi:WD40 repeat protein
MGTAASKRRAERDRDYLLQTLEEHDSAINCMAISTDGSVLATGSDDHNIRLWSTRTDSVECLGVLTGHSDYITHILIDENYLVSSSADRTMRKWDLTNSQCLFVYTGHTSLINRIVCTGMFKINNRLFLKLYEISCMVNKSLHNIYLHSHFQD